MRAVMRRMAYLGAAAAAAILLATGLLQSIPGAVRAATGPVVTGVSVPNGPEAGGTTVTVTGSGFTGATAVDFGSLKASSYTVNSDTSLTAVAPAASLAGPVDVTVVTADGTSGTSMADQFYYDSEFSYPPAGATDVPDPLQPNVTAADQNGNQIDIPYYVKPGGLYLLDSEDDGSGLYGLHGYPLNLSGGTPKDEWPLYAGVGEFTGSFVGASLCGSELWPFHTMSSPVDTAIDPNCWTLSIDAGQNPDFAGLWDVWVPSAVTDASGQTLVFTGWSVNSAYADDAATGQCATGDTGYVENWVGAGSDTPGVPGAFTGGEEFNMWGGVDVRSVEAQYALQSAGTTAPLIELGSYQSGRPSEFDCQWYQQNAVVAPQFSCVDQDGSGIASCAATAGVTAGGDLDTSTAGGHTLTITATDNDGNKRTLSVNYFVGQPPTITLAPDPAQPSATGWYNASQLGAGNSLPVTLTISPNPADDSIDSASCTLNGDTQNPIWSFYSAPDTAATSDNVPTAFTSPGQVTLQIPQGANTVSCTATDLSGETTTQTATYDVDSDPPVASPTVSGPHNLNTQLGEIWYTSEPTVTWNWSDPDGSALSNCPQTSTVSGEGGDVTVSASCTDAAGNQATASQSVMVDTTGPTVSVTGVQNGAQYLVGEVPYAGCTSSDSVSGILYDSIDNILWDASLSVTPAGSGPGSYTATCSGAMNNALLKGSASASYTVVSASSTVVSSSADASMAGNPVTLTATITPQYTGGPVPTGTVTFYDNGVLLGDTTLSTVNGVTSASITVTSLGLGEHPITARYTGDGDFTGGTSPVLEQYVDTSLSSYPKLANGAYNLAGANLHGAYLADFSLAGADLAGANLNGANLTGADLAGASLTGANFNSADLTGADLSGATVTGANFNKVTWFDTTCPNNSNSNADGGTCANAL